MFNNKTKTFLLLTIIFMTMLGVSAVTAADADNITDTTSTQIEQTTPDVEVQTTDVSNKEIIKNTQQETKTEGEGTFTDLTTDITGDEVTLTKDYVQQSGESAISITGNKVINGAGHTISDVTKGLFTVPADGQLTLKNLIVNAGATTTADVISLNGKLNLENVTFDMQNSARSSSSIVSYNTAGADATITKSVFKNFNTSAGGVYLYSAGNLNLDESTFTNISANNNPIKLNKASSTATIKNSNFTNNIGANQGGALCLNNFNQEVLVENCLFEGNIPSAGGGAISEQAKNLTIRNSVFKNNKMTGSGTYAHGTICIRNGNAVLYLENNVMDDPEITDAEIYVQSGKINNPVFNGETINAEAGEEITLKYNVTDDNGNSIYLPGVDYNLKFNGAYLVGSYERGVVTKTTTAPTEDGTYPIELSLSSTSLIDGDAIINDGSVIVGATSTDIIITDETYSNFFDADGNIIEGTIPEGSVAKFDGTFNNKVFNINIPLTIETTENQAVFADGCIFTITNDVTIQNVQFTGETGNKALLNVKGNIKIINTTFDGVNTQNQNIINPTVADTNITIENSAFKDTVSGTIVRATYARIGLNITDSEFTNNNAQFSPIQANGVGWKININNSKFTNNKGANGGVIQIMSKNSNQVSIDNSVFDSNEGSGKAGVLYSSGNNAIINVTNSNFTDNKVSSSSASSNLASVIDISNGNTDLTLKNNKIRGSTAENGTDIYFEAMNKQLHTDAKLIAEDATTDKDQYVDLKFRLTDDNDNILGFKGTIFAYNVTLNDEIISYIPDAYYGKIYGFNGKANKTLNATYDAGEYSITLTVGVGQEKFDNLEIVNGVLTVNGEEKPAEIIITDETYSNFFDADGNIIEGTIPEGSVAKFDGTFNNRNFNINIPMTIDTGDNPAVFDSCTFTITSDVTVQNVKITGGDSSNVITLKGNAVFENVEFTDIKATGAAIINVNSDSSVTITNCTVANFEGGAVISPSGATQPRIKLDITDSKFTNNNAAWTPIRINSNNWNVNIKDSTFTDNVGQNGGVLQILNSRNYNNITIDNCDFTNNAGSRAGVIQSTGNNNNITVTNSVFTNNKATSTSPTANLAGVIEINNANTNLYLAGNVMNDNEALTGQDIYLSSGGHITSQVLLTAYDAKVTQYEDVNITVNLTDDIGNTITYGKFEYQVKLNDEVIFSGNVSKTFTKNIDLEPGNYTITLTYDTDNYPTVVATNANLEVLKSDKINYAGLQALINAAGRNAEITLEGSVIRGAEEESVVIDDNVKKGVKINFNGNSLDAKNGRVFDISKSVTIKNAIITNIGNLDTQLDNTEGRLAIITGTNTAVTFENVTFENNTAPNHGSAASGSFIYITGQNELHIVDSTITNNTATFINNNKASVFVENTTFKDNNLYLGSDDNYNGLIANGGTLEVTDSEFINNTVNFAVLLGQTQNSFSGGVPGGIPISYDSSLTVTNTKFINNKATAGKGAAINTNGNSNIKNVTFIGNYQLGSNNGGAVYSDGATLTIEDSIFINNTANNQKGTAIYNKGGDLTIKNSIIISNVTGLSSVYSNNNKVTANANYWGTNTPDGLYEGFTIDNWAVLNISVDPEEGIEYEQTVTATVTLNTLNTGDSVTLPETGLNVTFTGKGVSITDENVLLKDGVATTTVKVEDSPFTITAEYPNTSVEYNGNARMPGPQVIELNDGNWTNYFNDDGTVKDFISPNSELRFIGEFNNRNMVITIPLNLTTADTQAVLKNSNFTINNTAYSTNITGIVFEANDIKNIIVLNNVEDVRIENNTLTLTNNDDKVITHTIEVNRGKNDIIRNNIITTTGPEDNIKYSGTGNNIETLYTTSIEAVKSTGLIIDNNTITTKSNGKTDGNLGTIYGVYVVGEYDEYYDEEWEEYENTEIPVEDIQIINNIVNTQSDKYAYGITANHVKNLLVENNTVTTTSKHYADGIQSVMATDSTFNNNTVIIDAETLGYGIIINGFMDYETYEVLTVEANTISNNNITINAENAWGIEVFIADKDNTVKDNTVTIDASNGVGIGLGDSTHSIVTGNNITVTATMDKEANNGDSINSYTAGIKIAPTVMRVKGSYNNIVTNNNITVTAPEKVPAVNLTEAGENGNNMNEITENYLVSPYGVGDNAVSTNTATNTIKDNTPKVSITTDKESYEFEANVESLVLITIEDYTTKGTIKGFIGESEEVAFTIENVDVGETSITTGELYDYIADKTQDSYNVTLVYVNEDNAEANTTFTLNIVKEETTIDYFIINDIEGKVVIQLTVYDSNGEEISNEKINVKVEDIEKSVKSTNLFKDTTLTPGDYEVTASFAGTPSYKASEVKIPLTVKQDPSKIIEELNNTVNDLNNTVQELNDTVQEQNKTIEELNNTVNDLNSTVQEQNKTIEELNNTVNDLNSTVEELNNTVQEQNKTIENLNSTVNDLNNTVEELNNTVDALNNTVQEQNKTIGELNNTVEELNNTFDALNNTVQEQNKTIGELNNTVEELNNTVEELNNTVGELNNTVNELNNTVQEQNKTIDDLNNTVNDLNNTVNNLNTTVNDLNDTVNDLNDTVQDQQKTIDDLNSTVNDLNDTVNDLNDTVKDQQKTIDDLNSTVNDLNDTVNDLNDTVKDQQETIDDLNETIKNQQALIDELLKQIKELTKPKATTITLDKVEDAKFNSEVTITGLLVNDEGASLSGQTVTLTVNGKQVDVKTVNGVFEYTTTFITIGEQTVTAVYKDTDKYVGSNDTTTFNVAKQDIVFSVDPVKDVKFGDKVTLTGNVKDADGNAIYNTNIAVKVNGKVYTAKTDKDGKFSVEVTANALENKVVATYAGNNYYNKATQEFTFKADKQDITIKVDAIKQAAFGDNVVVTGIVTDANGNVIYNTNVVIKVNGKVYTAKTDKTGKFTVSVEATRLGTNNVEVSYAGNNYYNSASTTATFNAGKQDLIATIDTVKVSGSNATITGKLTDKNGKALYSTNVAVKVNSKTVYVKTDNKGVYTLTTDQIVKGSNTITASYIGNDYYNAVSTNKTVTA